MRKTPAFIGFLQASGIALYVSLFARGVILTGSWFEGRQLPDNPVIGITVFLLVFIISATTCASLMFGYPARLFFSDRRREAVKTVGWTLLFLVCFFLCIGLAIILSL